MERDGERKYLVKSWFAWDPLIVLMFTACVNIEIH